MSEAVELVIQAGAMGVGGDVFVLDMGKPVLISDLAEKMIRLSGLEVKSQSNPNGDIEIIYTKLRPGEKLYEELLIGNNVTSTSNPLIMRAKEEMVPLAKLNKILSQLEIEVRNDNQKEIRRLLIELVPEFNPKKNISDILYEGD
jgi:FlaA1/EpsC-like NDP-sugar epimerase